MDLFQLSANISVAIQDAVDNLQQLGRHVSDVANRVEHSFGDDVEIDIETDEAEENLEDLEDDLEDTEDAMNDVEDKSGSLGSALGGFGKIVAGVGVAVVGLLGGFLGLAESTREYREDIGKLEVAFSNAGHSTELATETYKELYSILGESDRSVEAANHLAELTQNEKELAMWSDIAAGVVGRFGDSLPLESLTEASNETAKTGVVTGALADAINWAGASEEEFNQQLAQCNTEQERATLITEMLNGLYQEAGQIYKDVNGEVIDANKAQSNLTDTIAKFGAIAEPILTTLKILANDLLTTMLPFVELIGEGLQGVINGTDGATEKLADGIGGVIIQILNMTMTMLPTIMEVVTDLIGNIVTTLLDSLPRLTEVLVEILTQLVGMLGEVIPMIAIKLSEILPQIIIALLTYLPSLIDTVFVLVEAIIDALPMVIENLLSALPSVIVAIIDFLVGSIEMLVNASISLFNAIIDALPVIIQSLIFHLPIIITTITNALVEAIPLLLDAAIQLFNAILEALPTIIGLLVKELPKIIFTIQKALIDNYPILINAAITMFTAIIKAIPQILGGLGKAMGDIKDEIFDSLGEIDLFEMGKEILQGLIDGMVSIGKNIWGAVKGIGESVVNGFKDFFDIHSPSRLIKTEIGANVGEAIGVGAIETIPNIKKDINTLSNSVYDELSSLEGASASYSSSSGSNDDSSINRIIDRLDALENTFKGLRIYLNNDVLVGELMPSIDTGLGNLAIARERGR